MGYFGLTGLYAGAQTHRRKTSVTNPWAVASPANGGEGQAYMQTRLLLVILCIDLKICANITCARTTPVFNSGPYLCYSTFLQT